MWIIVLLIVGFVLAHFLPKSEPRGPEPSPKFRNEVRAVTSDPEWARYIEEHCESPAEVAFLRAMIGACNLQPAFGSLVAPDLRLDFQVEEGPYRLDFLINRWLVVEIDGAAYHSSTSAIARDMKRDGFLQYHGYSVLRIPAKIPLYEPAEAVRLVHSALKTGKCVQPTTAQKSGWQRLGETMTAINEGLAEISTNISKQDAINRALSDAKQIFDDEKAMIGAAVDIAVSKLEMQERLKSMSSANREMFQRSSQAMSAALADRMLTTPTAREEFNFRPFPSGPKLREGEQFSDTILREFKKLDEERNNFLQEEREKLNSSPYLKKIVKENLYKFNREEYFRLVEF